MKTKHYFGIGFLILVIFGLGFVFGMIAGIPNTITFDATPRFNEGIDKAISALSKTANITSNDCCVRLDELRKFAKPKIDKDCENMGYAKTMLIESGFIPLSDTNYECITVDFWENIKSGKIY